MGDEEFYYSPSSIESLSPLGPLCALDRETGEKGLRSTLDSVDFSFFVLGEPPPKNPEIKEPKFEAIFSVGDLSVDGEESFFLLDDLRFSFSADLLVTVLELDSLPFRSSGESAVASYDCTD